MKNIMKSRTAMSLLLIGLAAIIIGGATMAWFTGEDTIDAATFTAGTVVVNADGEPDIVQPEGKYFDNVNPGDCARVTWDIVNEGTKAVELRVNLSSLWSITSNVDPLYFCPPDDSGWVMYSDAEGDLWLYYTGGPVRGTYNPDGDALEPASVPLTLVVGFDGEQMGNEYQGASLTLGSEGSKVYAIQASNGAPDTVWGDVWTTVNGTGYVPTSGLAKTYYDYFHTGLGNDMPCWEGNDEPDPEDPDEIVVADFQVTDVTADEGDGFTTVSGVIKNLKDTNGDPITNIQNVTVVAKVNVIFDLIHEKSATKTMSIDFDENGLGSFTLNVDGVSTDMDSAANVKVTIGGITREASGSIFN